ncbi:hypothetical protein ACFLTS_04755 [Chloroflexota bacterium]
MSRARIFYVALLVILGALVGFAVWGPLGGGEYTEVQRVQLLEREDEWIVQLDIINHEGREQGYTINVEEGGRTQSQDILIPDGRKYTYISHFRSETLENRDISFYIYRGDEADPFKQLTYHLR